MSITSAARPLRATGMRAPNSHEAEEIRRAIQLGLPHGSHRAVADAAGKGRRRFEDEIEAGESTCLTVDALIHSLPFLEDFGPLRTALRKVGLFLGLRPVVAERFLPSVLPAAAEMFTRTGRLAEEAALAERDGVVTAEEADAIGADCGEARALLDCIEVSAEVLAGRRLVA